MERVQYHDNGAYHKAVPHGICLSRLALIEFKLHYEHRFAGLRIFTQNGISNLRDKPQGCLGLTITVVEFCWAI